MRKRKCILALVLVLSAAAVAAAFFAAPAALPAALILALPVIFLAWKPLIPTPAPIWYLYHNHIKPRLCRKKVPAPTQTPGGFRETEHSEFEADFYISTNGNDENAGTKDAPFATFDRAKRAVRALDKRGKAGVTVGVFPGSYNLSGICLEKADSADASCPVTYKALGGEVILNGGIRFTAEEFECVTDPAILRRLPDSARGAVRVADLAAKGLRCEDIGKICAIGTYHTADSYDGDWVGPQFCELFVGDRRQTPARWPNKGFARVEKVLFSYGGSESEKTGTFSPEWAGIRNPQSDIFRTDRETASRISSWESFDDVWMFGYWRYDWADASTPIAAFDPSTRALSPKFVSKWGIRKSAPYYFFNILEELDTEGEWYIDRKAMRLYLYPPKDFAQAEISLSVTRQSILDIRADHTTFDGFTIQGTRGDGVYACADGVTLQNCTVKLVAGNAVVMHGAHNRVHNCHIHGIGKGGVILTGGDRETLTPGNCVAENNHIHNWSENYKTYCPAVQLNGVGNICRRNEMHHSPHEVVWYHGNDHRIEYNHIHHACLLTKDGGAIYAGKSWSDYGSAVRGNLIHDLGSPYFTASAIYMDDGHSGQTICDNLLLNIPGIAIQLGGGRDLTVQRNTVVNCTNTPISYDNRAREGALYGGWFHYCSEPGGIMWKWLYEMPWKTERWQTHYPQMAAFVEDFGKADDPCFVPNPGCSRVTDNVIFDPGPLRGNIICREAKKYGKIENNTLFPLRAYKEE